MTPQRKRSRVRPCVEKKPPGGFGDWLNNGGNAEQHENASRLLPLRPKKKKNQPVGVVAIMKATMGIVSMAIFCRSFEVGRPVAFRANPPTGSMPARPRRAKGALIAASAGAAFDMLWSTRQADKPPEPANQGVVQIARKRRHAKAREISAISQHRSYSCAPRGQARSPLASDPNTCNRHQCHHELVKRPVTTSGAVPGGDDCSDQPIEIAAISIKAIAAKRICRLRIASC